MAPRQSHKALEVQEKSDAEPNPTNRRERRKLETRARIVETARDLFEEKGFAETRVADVCERADIAQKTFFNHFETKQGILREIANVGVHQLMLEIEEIRKAEEDTPARLRRLFDTVADHISLAGPHNRELLVELVHRISGDAAERSEQAARLHAALQGIVEDGLLLGDVTRRHDPRTLTEMILGAYYVLVFNYVNLEGFPIRERGRASAELLADALAPRAEERHGTA